VVSRAARGARRGATDDDAGGAVRLRNTARHVTGCLGESLVPPDTCGSVSLSPSLSLSASHPKKRDFTVRWMTWRAIFGRPYLGDTVEEGTGSGRVQRAGAHPFAVRPTAPHRARTVRSSYTLLYPSKFANFSSPCPGHSFPHCLPITYQCTRARSYPLPWPDMASSYSSSQLRLPPETTGGQPLAGITT